MESHCMMVRWMLFWYQLTGNMVNDFLGSLQQCFMYARNTVLHIHAVLCHPIALFLLLQTLPVQIVQCMSNFCMFFWITCMCPVLLAEIFAICILKLHTKQRYWGEEDLTKLWTVGMFKQHDKEWSAELKAAWELLVNLSHTVKEQKECWCLSLAPSTAVAWLLVANGKWISCL